MKIFFFLSKNLSNLVFFILFILRINHQSRMPNNLSNQTLFMQFSQTKFSQRSPNLHSFRTNSRRNHFVARNLFFELVPGWFVEKSRVLKLVSNFAFGPHSSFYLCRRTWPLWLWPLWIFGFWGAF